MRKTTIERRADWSDLGLLAGRARATMPVMFALIMVGSCVDTFAFKTTLDVFLRASPVVSWGMAIAITVLAQLAAWTLGQLLARWRHGDPAIGPGAVAAMAAAWLALGAGLWWVRWMSAGGAVASSAFGQSGGDDQAVAEAHAGAFLFLALFLVSGLVTAFEAFRTTNPWFTALERSGKRRERARSAVVDAESRAERARLAAAHHSGEFDRDLDRRDAAMAEREALAAELKNLARVYIAQLKQDPSVTDICSDGPVADTSDERRSA